MDYWSRQNWNVWQEAVDDDMECNFAQWYCIYLRQRITADIEQE